MRLVLSFFSSFLILFVVTSNVSAEGKPSVAIFAGGCFWCMEPPYDKLDGVISTTSGYIGGKSTTANYKLVASGRTDHVEAVKIEYDASKVSYETLLSVFWKNIDPFDHRGQFCDKGPQYMSYIYYGNEEEKALAQKSLAEVKKRFNDPVATRILPSLDFYPAEDYHQNYYQRNPIRYKYYRTSCGRDRRLKKIWGEKN